MEAEPLRREIEDTVVEILKTADLETITEYVVRTTVAQRLNIDFTDINKKRLVRRAVESYLLSLPVEEKIHVETKQVVQEQPDPTPESNFNSRAGRENNSKIICKLSDKRRVSVLNFGDKTLVSFGDNYQKDGKQYHSARGISLTTNQWMAFKNSIPAVEEAIVKMKSRKRELEGVRKQSGTDKPNTSAAVASEREIPVERKQSESGISNSTTGFIPEELNPVERQQSQTDTPNSVAYVTPNVQVQHNSVTGFPQELLQIETNRLTGRNYSSWMNQMYFFLKQLSIAYVLTEPCPNIPLDEKDARAKADAKKWVNDDYICRRNILSSLSDNLFHRYSKKTLSARELWEELKAYFNEDFGTKRSEVNKYLQFQMVDGVSVIGQVQELHEIADSIIASGMWIDENFHVSAIVSKLPPSWKEFRGKLMQEEFLPLSKLMRTLRVEEESQSRSRKLKAAMNGNYTAEKKVENEGCWKKEGKRLCYTCGSEGHIFKDCPNKKGDRSY